MKNTLLALADYFSAQASLNYALSVGAPMSRVADRHRDLAEAASKVANCCRADSEKFSDDK